MTTSDCISLVACILQTRRAFLMTSAKMKSNVTLQFQMLREESSASFNLTSATCKWMCCHFSSFFPFHEFCMNFKMTYLRLSKVFALVLSKYHKILWSISGKAANPISSPLRGVSGKIKNHAYILF